MMHSCCRATTMRVANVAAFAVFVVMGTAAPAAGQQPERSVSFGLLGGGSVPTGELRTSFSAGPTVGALIEVQTRYRFALRIDGTYGTLDMPEMPIVSDSLGAVVGEQMGRARFAGATASVVLRAPYREEPVQLYVAAGAGLFWVQEEVQTPAAGGAWSRATTATVRPAVNAKIGVEWRRARFTAFGEAGYQAMSFPLAESSLYTIPISIGLRVH